MVIHDIDDDRDTMFVSRSHKLLKGVRSPVNTFHGKGMRRIVPPRKVAWKFRDRHDFHGIDPQLLKIRKFFHGTREGARPAMFINVKGADMRLIDDQLIPHRHVKVIITPVEGFRIIDHPIANGVRHLPDIRVNAGIRALTILLTEERS